MGLNYTAAKGTGNSIVITLTGTATTALTADVNLTAVIKGSAVTETGAKDSAGIVLKLWYVGPGTTFVLTNEGGLIDKLIAAGHGANTLYDTLVFLQPYSHGTITDRFLTTLLAAPDNSTVFTVALSVAALDGNNPKCINVDGTAFATGVYGREYADKLGYTTAQSDLNNVGAVWVTAADAAHLIDAGGEGDIHYKAFAVAWMKVSAPPTVATNAVGSGGVAQTAAYVSGTVNTHGTVTETEYGFVCGTAVNPTIGGAGVTRLPVGSGITLTDVVFGLTLTGLTADTTYHVRAYALNGGVTLYGEDRAFTTAAPPSIPPSSGVAGASEYMAILEKNGIEIEELSVTVSLASGTGTVSMSSTRAASVFAAPADYAVVFPKITGVSAFRLELPASELKNAKPEGTLTLEIADGSLTMPGAMLRAINSGTAGTVGFTVGTADKSRLTALEKTTVGARPVVELTMTLDGVKTGWSNSSAPVTVKIPYAPTADELRHTECLIVLYLDGSGTPVCVPDGYDDMATGTVVFRVTHFSLYGVGYNAVAFNDIGNGAWFDQAVNFIAARSITLGTGGGAFSPGAQLTRAQVLVLLMRTFGIAPDENAAGNFSDAGNTWYTGYLAAARRLGIAQGVDGERFAPDQTVTRQEMFTLLYNALKVIGRLAGGESGRTLSDYSDATEIAPLGTRSLGVSCQDGYHQRQRRQAYAGRRNSQVRYRAAVVQSDHRITRVSCGTKA